MVSTESLDSLEYERSVANHMDTAPTMARIMPSKFSQFAAFKSCKPFESGTIKILFMTSAHSCREPEVGVKCCMSNFSKLVYCKVHRRRSDWNYGGTHGGTYYKSPAVEAKTHFPTL